MTRPSGLVRIGRFSVTGETEPKAKRLSMVYIIPLIELEVPAAPTNWRTGTAVKRGLTSPFKWPRRSAAQASSRLETARSAP